MDRFLCTTVPCSTETGASDRLGPLTGERALAGRKPQGKRNGRLWLVV